MKTKVLQLVLTLVFPALLASQEVNDYKQDLLEVKSEVQKKELFYQIACLENEPDSILKYGALAIAKNGGDKTYVWRKKVSDTISVRLWEKRGFKQLIDFSTLQLEDAKSMKDSAYLVDKYWKIGVAYEVLTNYKDAKKYYHLGISNFNANKSSKFLARIYSGLGRIYKYTYQDSLALVYMHKGLESTARNEDWDAYSTACNGLGLFYFHNEDYQQAIIYYEKILDIKDRLSQNDLIAAPLSNLGAAYVRIGKPQEGIDYLRQAIDLYKEAEFFHDLDTPYEGMGIAYRKLEDHKKALEYHEKAYSIRQKYNKREYFVASVSNITLLLAELDQADEALQFIKKEQLHVDSPEDFQSWEQAQAISTAYEKIDNYKKALKYQQFAFELKDSFINKVQTISLKKMEAQFNSKQQKQQIEHEKTKNELLESEKRVAEYLNYGQGILLLLFFTLIALLNRLLKLRKEQNEQLESRNQTLLKLNEKVTMELQEKKDQLLTPELLAAKTITLTSNGKEVLPLSDIIYLKAKGKAVQIFSIQKTHWDWVTLGSYEKVLPGQLFLKVHRSYIVNILHINNRKANSLTLSNGDQINIGKTQKQKVNKTLDQKAI